MAALPLIRDKVIQLKDMRTGIFLIKEATELAQTASQKKVTVEFVTKAIEKLNQFSSKDPTLIEDTEQKDILELIKTNSGKMTTELFNIYKEKGDKSYRSFMRRIQDLEKKQLVNLEEVNKGSAGGKSTKVMYKSLTEF